jgi:hypothetical protein
MRLIVWNFVGNSIASFLPRPSSPVKTSCADFRKNSGLSGVDRRRAEKKVKIGTCPRFPEEEIFSSSSLIYQLSIYQYYISIIIIS